MSIGLYSILGKHFKNISHKFQNGHLESVTYVKFHTNTRAQLKKIQTQNLWQMSHCELRNILFIKISWKTTNP